MAYDRLPPHDIDAEEAVNGSLLIDGKSVYQVAVLLRPEDFLSEANRWIYQAALSLYHRDEAIDQITVAQELERLGQLEKVGGAAYLNHLISIVPTSLDIEHYGQIVYRLSIMRQLISAADRISGVSSSADDCTTAAYFPMYLLMMANPKYAAGSGFIFFRYDFLFLSHVCMICH